MTEIYHLNQIKQALQQLDPIEAIEQGFIEYSQGKTVVPPVGELLFENPPGEAHIKYGYIKNDDYYVIKIASGFPNNYIMNLSPMNGLMLLFSQKTGELISILLDKGYLTNIRTAAAGAVVAKYLAPKIISKIGIVGTGIQARLQLLYLRGIVDCNEVIVWGRNLENLVQYKKEMEEYGYHITITQDMDLLTQQCNLIITCTSAKSPLIKSGSIRNGTHITALGSDTVEKQELDENILSIADFVVVDSLSQCKSRGEVYQAIKSGVINDDKVENIIELGNLITDTEWKRKLDDITVADLTGVAVQDIQITKAVYIILKDLYAN
ncbi:MAG: ornithine cyclodeaminase family protein [Candidatus Heimdallarchaeota archaeon]|nr:ornithine cyclodeaminase family protein [Candidatus Heimdallarchaeota archaeon]MDH5645713.1 ornithine cyclodeaminase family protein [Candidatus Heimdallarchaeota archaeon]